MAKLTAAQRKRLPDSDYALPGHRYPIEDRGHAEAALSEVEQHGSPAEIAKVRAAVKKHFPGMNIQVTDKH